MTLARRRTALRISIAALLATMGGLVAWKAIVLGYSFDNLIPRPSYAVDLSMTFTGYGDDQRLRTMEIRDLLVAGGANVTSLVFERYEPKPLDPSIFDPAGARAVP